MRTLALAVVLSLALAPSVAVHAADKCHDADGKVIACAKSTSDEVNVTKPPKVNRPDLEPVRPRPDMAMPPMATAVCRDGTYSRAQMSIGACETHGGVAQRVR